jgi:hypothetical protein
MPPQNRCPNGTRRNNKTGECVTVGSPKNTSRKTASPNANAAEMKCLEELAKLKKEIERKDKEIETLNENYTVLKMKYDNNAGNNVEKETPGKLKSGTILTRVLDFYFKEMPKGRLPKNADEKAAKLKELRKIVDENKSNIFNSVDDILHASTPGLSFAASSSELGRDLLKYNYSSENERQFEFVMKYLMGIPKKLAPKKIWDGDKLTSEDKIYFRDVEDYKRLTKVFYDCLTPAERSAAGIDNWEDCW